VVVHTSFNPSTWETEAGRSGLQNKFQDSQGYTEKPCLAKQTNKQTKKRKPTKQPQKTKKNKTNNNNKKIYSQLKSKIRNAYNIEYISFLAT